MNGCCLHAERSAVPPPVPAPGDNGRAYLDWGAVPECLWAEVTSCTTAGSSQLPSSRMPEASQQTFPGWQRHPAPPLPPPPHSGPQPGTGLAWLRSHPEMRCLWLSSGREVAFSCAKGQVCLACVKQADKAAVFFKAHTSLRGVYRAMRRTSLLDFFLPGQADLRLSTV